MYPLQQVTSAPYQRQAVILGDGSQVSLTLLYRPLQQGWFLTELSYKGTVLTGRRVVNSPNMLHQYRTQIPFGLACFSAGNREPSFQQDFSTGASKLYVLTAADVAAYQRYLTGG